MKLLIEIPEEDYERFGHEYSEENLISKHTNDIILDAFCNGTPLPEHHGDLVDKKEVYKKFYSRCLAEVATEVLSEVTTIIPATKEGE